MPLFYCLLILECAEHGQKCAEQVHECLPLLPLLIGCVERCAEHLHRQNNANQDVSIGVSGRLVDHLPQALVPARRSWYRCVLICRDSSGVSTAH